MTDTVESLEPTEPLAAVSCAPPEDAPPLVIATTACPICQGGGQVPDQAALGAAMRALRKTTGKSLRAIAKEMGVSPAYVSDLEHGHRAWNIERIEDYKRAVREAPEPPEPRGVSVEEVS